MPRAACLCLCALLLCASAGCKTGHRKDRYGPTLHELQLTISDSNGLPLASGRAVVTDPLPVQGEYTGRLVLGRMVSQGADAAARSAADAAVAATTLEHRSRFWADGTWLLDTNPKQPQGLTLTLRPVPGSSTQWQGGWVANGSGAATPPNGHVQGQLAPLSQP